MVGLNENRLGMQSTCRCDDHVGVDVLAGEITEEEPSQYDSRVLLFLPEIRFSLKPLLLRPTLGTLLSDVSLQLAHNDASRLRSFARNLAA